MLKCPACFRKFEKLKIDNNGNHHCPFCKWIPKPVTLVTHGNRAAVVVDGTDICLSTHPVIGAYHEEVIQTLNKNGYRLVNKNKFAWANRLIY